MGWVVLNNAARVGANYAALNPNAWGAPGNLAQQDAYDARVRDARSDAAFALAGCTSEAVPIHVSPLARNSATTPSSNSVASSTPSRRSWATLCRP